MHAVTRAVIRLPRVQRSQLIALFWLTLVITSFELCCRFTDGPHT